MPDPAGSGSGSTESKSTDAHDPTGLELAHSVATSVSQHHRPRKGKSSGRAKRASAAKAGREPVVPARSSAYPDERDPKLLGAALDNLVESKGWKTDLSIRSLLANWPLLVGATNAAHSWPESYAETVLTVRTESTVWATSLRGMAPYLVARLNAQLGDGTITRIKVLGPQGPSWKRGQFSVRDGRGPRDTYG